MSREQRFFLTVRLNFGIRNRHNFFTWAIFSPIPLVFRGLHSNASLLCSQMRVFIRNPNAYAEKVDFRRSVPRKLVRDRYQSKRSLKPFNLSHNLGLQLQIIFREKDDASSKNSAWLSFNEGMDPLILSDRFGLVHTLVQYVNHNSKGKPMKK